jgi:hypothetical protein
MEKFALLIDYVDEISDSALLLFREALLLKKYYASEMLRVACEARRMLQDDKRLILSVSEVGDCARSAWKYSENSDLKIIDVPELKVEIRQMKTTIEAIRTVDNTLTKLQEQMNRMSNIFMKYGVILTATNDEAFPVLRSYLSLNPDESLRDLYFVVQKRKDAVTSQIRGFAEKYRYSWIKNLISSKGEPDPAMKGMISAVAKESEIVDALEKSVPTITLFLNRCMTVLETSEVIPAQVKTKFEAMVKSASPMEAYPEIMTSAVNACNKKTENYKKELETFLEITRKYDLSLPPELQKLTDLQGERRAVLRCEGCPLNPTVTTLPLSRMCIENYCTAVRDFYNYHSLYTQLLKNGYDFMLDAISSRKNEIKTRLHNKGLKYRIVKTGFPEAGGNLSLGDLCLRFDEAMSYLEKLASEGASAIRESLLQDITDFEKSFPDAVTPDIKKTHEKIKECKKEKWDLLRFITDLECEYGNVKKEALERYGRQISESAKRICDALWLRCSTEVSLTDEKGLVESVRKIVLCFNGELDRLRKTLQQSDLSTDLPLLNPEDKDRSILEQLSALEKIIKNLYKEIEAKFRYYREQEGFLSEFHIKPPLPSDYPGGITPQILREYPKFLQMLNQQLNDTLRYFALTRKVQPVQIPSNASLTDAINGFRDAISKMTSECKERVVSNLNKVETDMKKNPLIKKLLEKTFMWDPKMNKVSLLDWARVHSAFWQERMFPFVPDIIMLLKEVPSEIEGLREKLKTSQDIDEILKVDIEIKDLSRKVDAVIQRLEQNQYPQRKKGIDVYWLLNTSESEIKEPALGGKFSEALSMLSEDLKSITGSSGKEMVNIKSVKDEVMAWDETTIKAIYDDAPLTQSDEKLKYSVRKEGENTFLIIFEDGFCMRYNQKKRVVKRVSGR